MDFRERCRTARLVCGVNGVCVGLTAAEIHSFVLASICVALFVIAIITVAIEPTPGA